MPANRLARWWQIENLGGGVTNANLHFGYLDSDIAGIETAYGAYRIAGGAATMVNSSVNIYSNYVTAPNVTGFSDWTLAQAAPTAANVDLSGRVVTANGRGITKVRVTLTDAAGNSRTALTSSFGYYRFEEVEAGQTYILSVASKRFRFDPPSRVVSVVDEVTDIDFVAEPN